MKPFIQTIIPESEERRAMAAFMQEWRKGNSELRKLLPDATTEEEAQKQYWQILHDERVNCEVWVNDVYQVSKRAYQNLVHLSIKRLDRQTIHDWRDLQEIKNQLVGEDCEGVELYPAEDRVIDTANQYHIWCISDPTYRFPFGWNQGRCVSDTSIGKSVNRPRT